MIEQFFDSMALIATMDFGVMPATLSSVSSLAEKNHQTNADLIRRLIAEVEFRCTRSTESEGQ